MPKVRDRVSLTPRRISAKYYRSRAGDRKGRHLRTKPLTRDEINEIRKAWENRKATQIELAVRYNVCQSTISRIVRYVFEGQVAA